MEALLEHMTAGTIRADSAGSNPKPLHPNPVRVMQARDRHQREPHQRYDEFDTQRFDVVVTCATRSADLSRLKPTPPHALSIADPALGPTDRASYPFERTATELGTRIRFCCQSCPSEQRGGRRMPNDETVSVRYMVDDVGA